MGPGLQDLHRCKHSVNLQLRCSIWHETLYVVTQAVIGAAQPALCLHESFRLTCCCAACAVLSVLSCSALRCAVLIVLA